MSSKRNQICLGLALLVIVGYLIFTGRGAGAVSSELGFANERITVSGDAAAAFSLPMAQVGSCVLRDDWAPGTPAGGGETKRLRYGLWENEAVGTYRSWTVPKLNTWIVLTTIDGETYVINYESQETTEELHRALHRYFSDLGLCVAGAPQ